MSNTIVNPTESIIANWRDADALRQLVGKPGRNESINWGSIPTNKAVIDAVEGYIVRIRTYDGMRWTARGGYGSPVADTTTLPESFRYEVEQHLPELAQWIGDPRAETVWPSGYCSLQAPHSEWVGYDSKEGWKYSRFTSGCSGATLAEAIARDAEEGEQNRLEYVASISQN